MILEYYQTIIGELYHLESYLSIQTEVTINNKGKSSRFQMLYDTEVFT